MNVDAGMCEASEILSADTRFPFDLHRVTQVRTRGVPAAAADAAAAATDSMRRGAGAAAALEVGEGVAHLIIIGWF